MTLHLSQLWVPLFLTRTWAPTHCGSWVPLTTERRHGLSIRPVQSELAVTHVITVDPARSPLRITLGQGSDGLHCLRTLPPRRDVCHLLPNAHDGTDVRFPMTAAHQRVGSIPHALDALGNLAPQVHVIVTHPILLHLTAGAGVARLPLVGPPGPAWLRGLLGVPPRRHSGGHLLIIGGPVDLPGAVSHHLRPAHGTLIIGGPLHHLGRLHLKGTGPIVSPHDVTAPGLLAWNVTLIHMTRTFACCDSGRTMMISIPPVPIHVTLLLQDNLPQWMTLCYRRKKYRNFPALSHYADSIPDNASDKQLVPYVRTSTSTASNLGNSEPLETHGLFQNYQSFHRLSGDTEKEACTAAYHDLTNLMLSQTEESPLINVSSSCPKTDEPFLCGFISSNELKKKHDKLHLQWPSQTTHKKVIDRTLALYRHGPPPKAGTSDKWPPPPVKNPWDKTFVPKEFPTTHKIPSTMLKRWDLHTTSPLMLRPPQSTAVPEVQDSEISKSSSWLEAFAARAAHTSMMSATSIVGVYNFQQKVLHFLRDSASKNNIQNDISLVDDLIQRANSMALEAHIMAHDPGATATELFTHLHMLRRRSVLDSPTVALPQRDKDRLLVMSVGGNDLFGPDARKVHEWKLDTEEEKVKLIARVFDERVQRDKSKKKPSSSDPRPPRSVDHRSPLAGLTRPTPKNSYNQKPGQPFWRPPKHSPYKARTGKQQRPQTSNRDRPAPSSSNRNDSRDQGQHRQDKESKGPQSALPFNRRGRGGRKRSRPQIGTNSFRLGGSSSTSRTPGQNSFPNIQR